MTLNHNKMTDMQIDNDKERNEALIRQVTMRSMDRSVFLTQTHTLSLSIIVKIHSFPRSTEIRTISFGLYGNCTKYTHGAVRNAELVSTYFPGMYVRSRDTLGLC